MKCFAKGQTQMTMNRISERFLFLIALAFSCLSFSPSLTSANFHHDYRMITHEQAVERKDLDETHKTYINDPPSSTTSSSLKEARISLDKDRSSIRSGARVRSNQHGLISVSILVEIEEYKPKIIPLSSGEKGDHYNTKERDGSARVSHAFEQKNSSTASLRDHTDDVIWTVSVEEIQVEGSGVKNYESISTPYSQLVSLEWNKTKELNEHATESSLEDGSNNGLLEQNIPSSEGLYSGTASCTFMIPVKRDDLSLRPRSAPSSSSLARTFIVSLIQSTRMAASMTNSSLHDHTRYTNNRNDRYKNIVLTRRLAMLQRKDNHGSQPTFDPVVNVFLYHRQPQLCHEVPQLDESVAQDKGFNSREGKPISDTGGGDNNDGSTDDSRNNFRDFLWTLLLLFNVHAIRSMVVRYILKLISRLKYAENSIDCALYGVQVQAHHGEDCRENMHRSGKDEKEGEGLDNEGRAAYEGCQCRENDSHCLGETEEENHLAMNSHSRLNSSFSEKNGRKISGEAITGLSEDRRQKDLGYNNSFSKGESEKKEELIGNSLHHNLGNSLMVHETVPIKENNVRLPKNVNLAAINTKIFPFKKNFLDASKPEFKNVGTSLKSSLDPPLKNFRMRTSIITNRTNKQRDLGDSYPNELPGEHCRLQNDGTSQSFFKEDRINSRCNDSPDQQFENPSEAPVAQAIVETCDTKVDVVTPLELASEKLLMVDSMRSVNSGRDAQEYCQKASLHDDNMYDDNLLPKDCEVVNLIAAGMGVMQRPSIDRESKGGNIIDQTKDGHDLEKRSNESSMQVENHQFQFSKNGTNSKESGSSNHVTKSFQFDMTQKSRKENLGLGHDNDSNSLSKDVDEVEGYWTPSCKHSMEGLAGRNQETTKMGSFSSKFDCSSPVPPQGLENRLCQFNEDLSKISEKEFNGRFLGNCMDNGSDQAPKSAVSGESNFKQIQSHSGYKNDESQGKQKIQNCQGSETEESYVSTLPPDSDYASEDDPFLLRSGSSYSKLKPLELQSTTNNSRRNEQKQNKNSTDTKFRKRKNMSQCNKELPDEGAMTGDPTLTMIDAESLQKEVQKETDLDSVEVVGVKLPDRLEKRVKRPYRKSNYVADWVPSNELQSISQEFLQEKSWDIVPTPL